MTTQGAQSLTAIYFTIDGRQGILEARHIAKALHIPFQPEDPTQFRQWSPISQRDMVRILSRGTSRESSIRRKELPSGMLLIDVLLWSNISPLQHLVQRQGPILDALFRISEGFYFRPHHLIMAALLCFEEKVHRKKIQRADTIPLLFPRLLYHILEYMGYPIEPHLERRHHCREHFTLNQWTQLSGKNLPRPASLDERPTDSILPALAAPFMPQATSTNPPATPPVSPAAPPTSRVPMTISATEFRAMIQLFKTLIAMHNALFQQMRDICAHQDQHTIILDQHTAILRQIRQHLGLPPLQTDIPGPSEPIAPAEEIIRADVPPQAHSGGSHRAIISITEPHYLIISLLFVFTYYISRHNSLF
ncbi:hypothetical protein PVL29_013660 [Vitis rotundifolia]|uniref:Uncharacterized protein n=1 Tax=Vitis rotundifolia TaxID=103349 RepID=A0AA38ZM01_VITRO|nr:hypothetical protein PVL29_013660 [Vitis rotundifolia]